MALSLVPAVPFGAMDSRLRLRPRLLLGGAWWVGVPVCYRGMPFDCDGVVWLWPLSPVGDGHGIIQFHF